MHPYLFASRPHLFGHRGASGEAPENTRVAFELALAQGMGFLEMDCHASQDGEIVIIHDADVGRVTNGAGPVTELRFRELSELDAGFHFSSDGRTFPYRGCGVRIPLLAEILEGFPGVGINLEVKQAEPPIAEEVVRIVRQAGAQNRVLLAAAEDDIMEDLHRLNPGTALGSSVGDVADFFKALGEKNPEAFVPRGDALQLPTEFAGRPLITPESVATAHRHGLALHVWTINEPAEMRRLLALGVDGLMSDFPERLRQVAEAHANAP
jgi:glycerophosphoryl diester phosphodiesterase